MKMKKVLIYIFALLLTAPGWSREFYRLGGLEQVRVVKVTHRGILVSHSRGICNLDLKKLSAQDKNNLKKELLELQQKQQEQQEQQHERELFRKRRFQNFVKQQEAELNDFILKAGKMSREELKAWLKKRNLLNKSQKAFLEKYAHASNKQKALDAITKRITQIEDGVIEKLASQCKDKDFQSMKRFFADKFKRKFSDDDLLPFLQRNFPNTKKIAEIATIWNREKKKYLDREKKKYLEEKRERENRVFSEMIKKEYDAQTKCTIYKASIEYYHNMFDEGGIDLNYHFGFRFYKLDENKYPTISVVFKVMEKYALYTDYISVQTRSGKVYTIKVRHKEKQEAWHCYDYYSFAFLSADEYKKYFLNDLPEKIQVTLNNTKLVFDVGPKQKQIMQGMANFFKQNFL